MNNHLIKVEFPQDYWWNFEQSSSWNFTLDKSFLMKNKNLFLINFLSIGVKYGIIIPAIVEECECFLGSKINLLQQKILSEREIDFRELFYNPFISLETNKFSIKSNLYINNGNNIMLKCFQNYLNPYNLFDIQIIDKFRLLLYTDAFFSELHNKKDNLKSVSNNELAYLNTTRLNSYLRDLLVLMLQYKAVFDFENGFEINSDKNKSMYFRDMYLLIDGEVLYYEDIYNLLPEEHKYKPFEEIQVELDDTNYKKYMASREN